MNYFGILMQLLRDRAGFLEQIEAEQGLDKKSVALLICSAIFFAIYGSIIGSFGGVLQAISSAIKLPALYLLTTIICLPTLYFFDVILGSKRSFPQYLTLLLSSMAMISVMLFGFAPVTLFFRISIVDYYFFQILNIIILAITGIVGVNFFYKCMLSVQDRDSSISKQRNTILRSWLFLYAFVGSQLGWTLRPFFSTPGQPFAIFREIEGNFYVQVFKIIGNLLGFH